MEEKKVYIQTLGCQMNKSDTERVLGMLSHFNYIETKIEDEADLFIINTCAIRQLSADKAYSRIGWWKQFKKKKPSVKIVLMGCVAQLEKENLLKKFPYLDLVLGPRNIYELPRLLETIKEKRVAAVNDGLSLSNSENDYKIIREKGVSAWLPIMEGCDNFCSYCVVPYTRGREKSRTVGAIIKEAKSILKNGFSEIILLGQNVDSYGKNLISDNSSENPDFSLLLKELDNLEEHAEGKNYRIRFTSSYPTDIKDSVIETVKNSKHICECFHIPMQSGSDRVLKEMNRRYSVEEYAQIVKKIRTQIKDVTITSDFIAGFPSETEEEFFETVNIIEKLELDYSNTAAYSPRPITKAGKMTDKFISEEEKKRRLNILNEKVKEMSLKSNSKYIGRTLEILIDEQKDGVFQGRTRNNKVVHIENNNSDKNFDIGSFVDVEIERVSTWCMFGHAV